MDNRKIDEEIKGKYKLDDKAIQLGDQEHIRKTKADFDIDESFDDIEIQTPEKQKIENIKTETDEYLLKAVETADEEQKIYLKYVGLGIKQKEGKELTEEETSFMKKMNELYSQQNEQEEELAKLEQENEEQKKKVIEDYKEAKKNNPETITSLNLKNNKIDGSSSIPHLLKFVMAMKTAKKKGGKILVKVTRDRSVFFEWTNKPITFIEFWTTDEKGTQTPEITRFNEFKYNFEGQPIPVLFAIQGYAEGFDFFGEFRKDITSEYVARIASKARHAGFLEGLNQSDKEKKSGLLGTLTEYMPLILILGILVLGWLMYTMYGEMAVLYQTMKELQAQLPMVVN